MPGDEAGGLAVICRVCPPPEERGPDQNSDSAKERVVPRLLHDAMRRSPRDQCELILRQRTTDDGDKSTPPPPVGQTGRPRVEGYRSCSGASTSQPSRAFDPTLPAVMLSCWLSLRCDTAVRMSPPARVLTGAAVPHRRWDAVSRRKQIADRPWVRFPDGHPQVFSDSQNGRERPRENAGRGNVTRGTYACRVRFFSAVVSQVTPGSRVQLQRGGGDPLGRVAGRQTG